MQNLELEYVGPGKWITVDGAFGIIKKFRPINPMETSEVPSKMNKHLFSIRDLRDMDMTGTFYELAPEIHQARRFKDVHPWLLDFAKKEKMGLSESIEESEVHKRQVALMNFLSGVAKKHGVAKHVYVVGGAVRDFILGHPIKDVDVVIDAVALKGKDSAWFAKQVQREILGQTNLTTNQYGVAILTIKGSWKYQGHDLKGEVIEIANARAESYAGEGGKGYKPTRVTAASIEKDVKRREFTFNTLMWRLSDLVRGPEKAEVIDLTGCGLKDLKRGEMACPSDPDKTFRDDPTRMLRAIKFLIRYDWKITPEVKAAIRRNAHTLKKVPQNAVATLLINSVLKEKTYKVALREMKTLGLLDVIADMLREDQAFANTMKRWVGNQKVQFMLDLMDIGWPVGSKIGFLSKSQKERLRQVIIGMEKGEPEKLVDVLKQPGKAMDMRALMRDLKIQGRDMKVIMDVSREQLLRDPSIITNRRLFTDRVKRAATAKLSEGFDGMLSVDDLLEKDGRRELHLYDFDHTLFRAPEPPPDYPGTVGKWYSSQDSLGRPCVPDKPGSDWWNADVVSAAKDSISNPDVWAIMSTGRADRVFRYRIPELLKTRGLKFDAVYLNKGGPTDKFKLGILKDLIQKHRISRVVIWDDTKEFLNTYVQRIKRAGIEVESHLIPRKSHEPECSAKDL